MFAGHHVVCYEAATVDDVRRAHVVVAAFKNPKRVGDGWEFQKSMVERLGMSSRELMGKVLVHLDDEYGARTPRSDSEWHHYCALYVGWKHVFRNYWSEGWSAMVGRNHVMNCSSLLAGPTTCANTADNVASSDLALGDRASRGIVTTNRVGSAFGPRVEWTPLGWSANWQPWRGLRPSSQRSVHVGFYGNEKYQLRPNRGALMARFEREAGVPVDGRMLGRVGFGRGNASEYVRLMHDTRLCLQISGLSAECYRMYEALDAGCVPILINEYGNPSSPSAAIQYQFLLAHGSNGRVAGNRVTESAVAQQRRQPRLHFLGHAPFPFVQAPSELHDSLARLLSDPAALDALQGATSLWWNHSLLRLRSRVVDRGRSSQCEHK